MTLPQLGTDAPCNKAKWAVPSCTFVEHASASTATVHSTASPGMKTFERKRRVHASAVTPGVYVQTMMRSFGSSCALTHSVCSCMEEACACLRCHTRCVCVCVVGVGVVVGV